MLKNKIIAVTGGSGLLGGEMIKHFRSLGAETVCLDISFEGKEDKNNRYIDITSEESVKKCIAGIIKDFGRIDGWVNNAYPRTKDWGAKIDDIPYDSWRKNVDMHLNGYFLCSREIMEVMQRQGSGSLVNMSSIYGMLGPDFSVYAGTQMTMPAAYSAIKGGLINLTRYLAAWYGPYGVRANCVAPGGIFDNQPESFVKNYETKTPLRRMGKPKDIAPAVAFLLSDSAGYITGHNLPVDGGWSAI
ncbi:NAD(P)-dependent dehydrogenase [Parelusimicrobium proximum]|uniref:SDR family oxidoreductase n=1 Tax=Parelusimicrobium proximum TaxID=3228953 RepID=UPI003D173BBE